MAGFYAENQCTLNRSSANIGQFLSGDWSQGGVGSWLALTTESQNNPYTLYQSAETQLGSNVSQAQQNRRQDIAQSNGFISWCGKSAVQKAGTTLGVNVTDLCTTADGAAGNVQTPGIAIDHYLQKVTGLGFDQELALLSSSDNNLDAALQQVMENVFTQALSDNNNGGLAGASQPSGDRPSLASQLQNYTPDTTGSAGTASSTAQTVLDRVAAYLTALGTVETAANTASTSVTALATYCAGNASSTQAKLDAFIAQHPNDTSSTTQMAIAYLQQFIAVASGTQAYAQAALSNEIAPVLEQTEAASSTAENTRTAALQVQAEAAMVPQPISLASDVANLTTMPPAAYDVSDAQSAAAATGGAKTNDCSPQSILVVSGGTTFDQMTLLDTNAQVLMPACDPVASTTAIKCNSSSKTYNPQYSGGSGGGGGGSDNSGWWALVLDIITIIIAA